MAFEEMMTGGLSGMGGGQLAALIALGVFAVILALIALAVIYVYTSWAWMTIARKLKHKHPWLAWIPIANGAMVLQLGGFHWAWIFLILIPFLGWIALAVLGIISCWRIFEKRKYPGWLALIPILGFVPWLGGLASLAFLIILGFVAWKDQ
jgi:hypothetical protein